MKYPVIGDPPSLGAVHDKSIRPLLYERDVPKSVAVSPVTWPGAVGAAAPKNCFHTPPTFTNPPVTFFQRPPTLTNILVTFFQVFEPLTDVPANTGMLTKPALLSVSRRQGIH